MEVFTIATAVVSIILGGFAIWLSFMFYRMSDDSLKRMQETSKDLASNVTTLEQLFSNLYSDTFTMMRDTYSDMRRHVWPEISAPRPESEVAGEIERRTDEKIEAIRSELMQQISAAASRTGSSQPAVELLTPAVETAILRSRNAESEAREETLQDFLLKAARTSGTDGIPAVELFTAAFKKNNSWSGYFFPEIRKLQAAGRMRFEYTDPGGNPGKEARIYYLDNIPGNS